MKENVLGSLALMSWLGAFFLGLGLLRASIRIGGNPYALNQVIYYVVLPFLVCTTVAMSMLHTRRVRRKPTGFDPAIYIPLYLFTLIALFPFMFFYTGGI